MKPITRIFRPMSALSMMVGSLLLCGSNVRATTSQFRGVNWADTRDNFQPGVLYLCGLGSTDTYASASVTTDKIVGQFVSKLGTNAIRIPINEATAATYWSTYTGAIDMALTKGRVILCYWGPAHGAAPADMTKWWTMWTTVTTKYGNNKNCYFELYNEPNMYSKTDLLSLYASWLQKFPAVPQGHVILDGTSMAQNVPDVGSDSRFSNCLLAVHEYTMFGNSAWTTEAEWTNHFKGYVGSYADRTVATEWGGPMSTGSKNGITYQPMNYNVAGTNFYEAYIRGISQQLHDWRMGSFYWPGLRDGDWYSMTTRSGTGAGTNLTISNQSGVDRMHYSWTDTVPSSIQTSRPNSPLSGHPMLTSEGTRLRLEFTPQSTGSGSVKLFGSDGRPSGSSNVLLNR